MRQIAVLVFLVLTISCGVAEQPKSARTVAAYEVPLTTAEDREEFLHMLSQVARAENLHVDAATDEDLHALSATYRQTISAAVWRGANDDESIALVMDGPDQPAWLTFSRGEDERLSRRFREQAVRRIMERWPHLMRLPIMPTGAIPHPHQLIKSPNGYTVSPETLADFEEEARRIRSNKGGD